MHVILPFLLFRWADEVYDTITEDIMDSIVSDDKLPNVVQDKHETPNNWLKFDVEIKEGRNLPLITYKDRREPPVTYVSISNGLKHFTSDLVKKSCHPQWNFQGLQFSNIVNFCVFYNVLFIFFEQIQLWNVKIFLTM